MILGQTYSRNLVPNSYEKVRARTLTDPALHTCPVLRQTPQSIHALTAVMFKLSFSSIWPHMWHWLLDDLKDRRGYCQLKEEALDRTMWRNRFGRGFVPVVWQITAADDVAFILRTRSTHKLHTFVRIYGLWLPLQSYNKSQRVALFLKFILIKNSTCFGQIYCPSSGV